MIDQVTTNGTEKNTQVNKAADFIARIIESCQDTFHLKCAQKLLELFRETYYNKHGGKIEYERLQTQIVNKIPMIQVTA